MKKGLMFRSLVIMIMVVLGFSLSWAADRPIRILMLDPMSGPMTDSGERFLAGIRFAVRRPMHREVLGRKVEVIYEDSQVKPDVAVRKAQKIPARGERRFLVHGHRVPCRKGHYGFNKTAQRRLYQLYDAIRDGKDFAPHSVRLVFNTSMLARALVAYVAQNKALKNLTSSIRIILTDAIWGQPLTRELLRQIPGGQIVGEDYHPLSAKDMSPFFTKIKASNADVILSGNYGTDLSILLKAQRQELGVKALLVNNMLGMSDGGSVNFPRLPWGVLPPTSIW